MLIEQSGDDLPSHGLRGLLAPAVSMIQSLERALHLQTGPAMIAKKSAGAATQGDLGWIANGSY